MDLRFRHSRRFEIEDPSRSHRRSNPAIIAQSASNAELSMMIRTRSKSAFFSKAVFLKALQSYDRTFRKSGESFREKRTIRCDRSFESLRTSQMPPPTEICDVLRRIGI